MTIETKTSHLGSDLNKSVCLAVGVGVAVASLTNAIGFAAEALGYNATSAVLATTVMTLGAGAVAINMLGNKYKLAKEALGAVAIASTFMSAVLIAGVYDHYHPSQTSSPTAISQISNSNEQRLVMN